MCFNCISDLQLWFAADGNLLLCSHLDRNLFRVNMFQQNMFVIYLHCSHNRFHAWFNVCRSVHSTRINLASPWIPACYLKFMLVTPVLTSCLSPKFHNIIFFNSSKINMISSPVPRSFLCFFFAFYLYTFVWGWKFWFSIVMQCACTCIIKLVLFCGNVPSNILLSTHRWLLLLYLFIVPYFN